MIVKRPSIYDEGYGQMTQRERKKCIDYLTDHSVMRWVIVEEDGEVFFNPVSIYEWPTHFELEDPEPDVNKDHYSLGIVDRTGRSTLELSGMEEEPPTMYIETTHHTRWDVQPGDLSSWKETTIWYGTASDGIEKLESCHDDCLRWEEPYK